MDSFQQSGLKISVRSLRQRERIALGEKDDADWTDNVALRKRSFESGIGDRGGIASFDAGKSWIFENAIASEMVPFKSSLRNTAEAAE